MATKNFYANMTFAASAVILGVTVYLIFFSGGPYDPDPCVCDNGKRIEASMSTDHSIIINKTEAQAYFDEYRHAVSNKVPFGVWIGKELIDQLFTCNYYNGVYILLGADGMTAQTCFMIKGGREPVRTSVTGITDESYVKLDAMCPTYCDGLDYALTMDTTSAGVPTP